MSFSDPTKIKVDGTTTLELPRVSTGDLKSEYLKDDGTVKVKVSTSRGRRIRHQYRVDLSKIAASTITPSQNEEVSSSIYLVIDRPLSGYTNEELKKAAEGLMTALTESTSANLKKLLGSES